MIDRLIDLNDWMNEWIELNCIALHWIELIEWIEWMNERMNEWLNERMYVCMYVRMYVRTCVCMYVFRRLRAYVRM